MKRGRPRVPVAAEKVREMKESGMSYRAIGRELGIDAMTAYRILLRGEGTRGTSEPLPMQPMNFATAFPPSLEAR